MTTLTQASSQWMSRPADQRFTSLPALAAYTAFQRDHSRAPVVSSRKLRVTPAVDVPVTGLAVTGPNGHAYSPSHWAFGQLAGLAGAPAGYLRGLPAPIAADCLNYGLKFKRAVEDVGCLIRRTDDETTFAAATGPNYGRIWNADIADMLVSKFGDGVTGNWRVPGEFGKRVEVSTDNTTIYASDRDMFVFLADEDRRVTVPNRRDGKPGELARGFFLWNSEVGSSSLGAAFFLFDYVCCNRIVWGAEQFTELRIRHTSGAPDKWLERVVPVLADYSEASAQPVQDAIATAQARKVTGDLDEFLAARFGRSLVDPITSAHLADEGRPMETLWDVATGATAYARTIGNQDARVALERKAGLLLAA